MLKENIIIDLVKWIEQNIEQPLSIDIIAEKSGYSKWHLQRLFKEVTGFSIASYIRQRRLTYAVLSLKMTDKSILDIVKQYQFESQQAFTHLFKQQFGCSPAYYRRQKNVKLIKLVPEIGVFKADLPLPEYKLVTLPEKNFWGVTYQNNSSLRQVLKEQYIARKQFFSDYFSEFYTKANTTPEKIFAFGFSKNNSGVNDEQQVFYTIALEKPIEMDNVKQFTVEEGLYLCLNYQGEPENFEHFVLQVYLNLLPTLDIKRRNGSDVEVFYTKDIVLDGDCKIKKPVRINCDYYIPVIIEDES